MSCKGEQTALGKANTTPMTHTKKIQKTSFSQLKQFVFTLLKKRLPRDLHYHRPEHTRDVLAAAIRLGKKAKLNDHDMLLLKTAALFHDLGFIKGRKNNEEIGAALAQQHLPTFGYTQKEIGIIKRMILATTVPQRPKTKIEKLLCDADLDNFGRKDFFVKSELVRREEGKKKNKEWHQNILTFVSNHHYHSPEARALRNRQKQKNMKKLKKMLSKNV